jgi:hypothetical protein
LPAVERIAAGIARWCILFLVSATDEHDADPWDNDYAFREAINAADIYAGSDGIPSSVTARLILVGVLPKTCLIGQSVRCNCWTPNTLQECIPLRGTFDCC